jgi:hypothetical protein
MKDRLFKSWGERADTLNCHAELKYFDRLSPWACYIIAINPFNEDEIACIINGYDVEVCKWSFSELLSTFNAHGERPQIDPEFYRIRASELLKKLNQGKYVTR